MPSFYVPFFHSDFHSVATENIVLTAFASMSLCSTRSQLLTRHVSEAS